MLQKPSLIADKDFPNSYFDLMQMAGSKGLYQKISFIIFFFMWLITSLLVMSTSFLFLNPKYDCRSVLIQNQTCEDYVCSLPENQRYPFFEDIDMVSLATQYGPYECDKLFQLSALRMTFYIGVFFGYLFVFYFTDNFGRKFSMILAWSITVFGLVILSSALNIWMACCGLFFAGLGSQTCIRITITLIGQTVENSLRQKYSIALQISFGIGSIIIGLSYLWIGNWRIITIVFCLFPSIILLFLLIFYVEQTPKFLIKKSLQNAVVSLNRIRKINNGQIEITLQDIQKVAKLDTKILQKRTPLDLCRFKSTRHNLIFASISLFCINFLYMGPAIIISELSFSIFTSQIILGATEAVAYPFCSLFIEKLPRKISAYFLIGTALVIFVLLVFINPPKQCENCLQGILELTLVFIARFGICAYFSVFFLYITELFPLPLRGIGFGMTSFFGGLANFSSQFILSSSSLTKIDPMILFAVICGIGCTAINFLPQTLNKKLEQNIKEENQQKQTEQI